MRDRRQKTDEEEDEEEEVEVEVEVEKGEKEEEEEVKDLFKLEGVDGGNRDLEQFDCSPLDAGGLPGPDEVHWVLLVSTTGNSEDEVADEVHEVNGIFGVIS